jgi:hypothetical protein
MASSERVCAAETEGDAAAALQSAGRCHNHIAPAPHAQQSAGWSNRAVACGIRVLSGSASRASAGTASSSRIC